MSISSRFIKFIPSNESRYLQEKHPNAFLLLCQIANRTTRISENSHGLEIGEALIGDYLKAGIATRDKYRTAVKVLVRRSHIKIIETCRTRKKTVKFEQNKIPTDFNTESRKKIPTDFPTEIPTEISTERATFGTKVKLLRSDVWDVNLPIENGMINQHINHRNPHRLPQEQECTKNLTRTIVQEQIVKDEIVVPLLFSPKEKKEHIVNEEAVLGIMGYLESRGLQASFSTIEFWIKTYSQENVINTISYMLHKPNLTNPVGAIVNALKNDYFQKSENEKINREFAMIFKAEKNLINLRINKTCCTDQVTMNDYQYKLDPDMFKNMLERKYAE